DARAADAGHDDAVSLGATGEGGLGQWWQAGGIGAFSGRLLAPQLPPLHSDQARAEALEAGEILVAAALVDAALAAQLGLDRLHAQAVGLHGAVAATFADLFVDHHAPCQGGLGPALATSAQFSGASLLVD